MCAASLGQGLGVSSHNTTLVKYLKKRVVGWGGGSEILTLEAQPFYAGPTRTTSKSVIVDALGRRHQIIGVSGPLEEVAGHDRPFCHVTKSSVGQL